MATDQSYRPQLDGLRAVAVAAVAWSHWERSLQFGIPFGAGVHLFFVLSGFLITGILLAVRGQTGRAGAIRAFYLRRALRIFPAFYATLALAWWAAVPPVRDTLWWHVSYLSNVQIFLSETWPGSISHLWSLAVEEQFYLLWPWVIVFAPRRWLTPLVTAAVLAAPVFRWVLASAGYRESLWAVLTPGCLDSLGLGALLALHRPRWGGAGSGMARATPGRRMWHATAAACTAGWVSAIAAEAAGAALPLAIVAAKQLLQAVVFAWLVLGAAEGFRGPAGRLLAAAPVVYLGRISYGIYLAHGFAGDLLAGVGVNSRALPEPLRLIVLAAVTVLVAAASWHLMERPINALKSRVPYSPRHPAPAAAVRYESPRPSPVGTAP